MNLTDMRLYKGSPTQKTSYSVLQQGVQQQTRPIHRGRPQHGGGLGREGPGLMKMFSDLIWGLLTWLNINVNTYQCDKLHQL